MKKVSLFIILFIIFLSYSIEEVVVDRTLTKAICNENVCRDFLVACSGFDVVRLEPISGFVTLGDGWIDKRNEEQKLKLC